MLNNIDMEFIQAFNPLYAIPIVAVIFCAVIVYALGFKSPIQPPSFEGLEEDKKSNKKRKTKESQKQNKIVTNGKSNGIATAKVKGTENQKKKDVVDNNEKPKSSKNNEKSSSDKKAAKKGKQQNEKQPQDKKKENIISDEVNDDGWVQLISKKGKKNRKKDDNIVSEAQSNSNQPPTSKIVEINDAPKAEKISPKVTAEVAKEEKKQTTEVKQSKKSNKKETIPSPTQDNSTKLEITVEVKPVVNHVESDLKELPTNIPTPAEDTSKTKKKKKKQGATPASEEIAVVVAPPMSSETISKIVDAPATLPKIPEPTVENVPVSKPDDSKTNVVFDELAGLYPEAKEKKKKKVRRDH